MDMPTACVSSEEGINHVDSLGCWHHLHLVVPTPQGYLHHSYHHEGTATLSASIELLIIIQGSFTSGDRVNKHREFLSAL